MTSENRIMIVAGEASADVHAAALVRELSALRPGLSVAGIGGHHLKAAGADLGLDLSKSAVVGLTELLPELGQYYRAYRAFLEQVRQRPPRGVILLDLPDFNLFLAKKIRRLSPETRILYYISPQVWAWRPGRVKKIAARADAMLVLFPFEADIYRKAGMDVEFVGHPLADLGRELPDPGALRREFGLTGPGPVIAVLPGSRKAELKRYLPALTGFMRRLAAERPKVQWVTARAPTLAPELFTSALGDLAPRVRIVPGRAFEVLRAADLAVMASGTVTLEAAIAGTPMIVLGATSRLTYLLIKPLIMIPCYTLPNIIAGREVVPELVQREANPERIRLEALAILDHPERREKIQADLRAVKEALGPPGASRRAAQAVARRLWGIPT